MMEDLSSKFEHLSFYGTKKGHVLALLIVDIL